MFSKQPGDLGGGLQCPQSVLAGNDGRLTGPDAVQKRGDFGHQGVALLKLAHRAVDFRDAGKHLAFSLAVHSQLLVLEVDADVGVRLKNPHFSFTLHADPAGGDVGDATVLELYPDVGDIDIVRQHRYAIGLDALYRGADKIENDVDIVNNEIQNDIDIGAPRVEGGDAQRFDELGLLQFVFERHDGGVEPLQVADLENQAGLAGGNVDQFLRLFDRGSDGFFQQYMNAVFQEHPGHLMMFPGGDHDADRIDLIQQLVDVGKRFDAMFLGHGPGDVGTGVTDGDQFGVRQSGILLGMEFPQITDADDSGSQWRCGRRHGGTRGTGMEGIRFEWRKLKRE